MSIPPEIRPRVGQLLRLLASDHDGEVVAACRALSRTLQSVDLDLNDLAATIETPSATKRSSTRKPAPGTVIWSLDDRIRTANVMLYGVNTGQITGWDATFVADMVALLAEPVCRVTAEQASICRRIKAKVNVRSRRPTAA